MEMWGGLSLSQYIVTTTQTQFAANNRAHKFDDTRAHTRQAQRQAGGGAAGSRGGHGATPHGPMTDDRMTCMGAWANTNRRNCEHERHRHTRHAPAGPDGTTLSPTRMCLLRAECRARDPLMQRPTHRPQPTQRQRPALPSRTHAPAARKYERAFAALPPTPRS